VTNECAEPFALTCDSCGEPLLPNLSQADADGCLWICQHFWGQCDYDGRCDSPDA